MAGMVRVSEDEYGALLDLWAFVYDGLAITDAGDFCSITWNEAHHLDELAERVAWRRNAIAVADTSTDNSEINSD